LLIGFFVDRILGSGVVPRIAPYGAAAQLAVDALGVLIVGLGSGLYLRANLGAGPRDGLMLGLHRLTGRRIAVTRATLELCVAAGGFALGGSLGIGTLVFALGIGPAVEVGFWVFGVPRQRVAGEAAKA
ncbi:MAG: YitT family protein, partial [Chloroflexota bacterium]